jgi:hypothetical protein
VQPAEIHFEESVVAGLGVVGAPGAAAAAAAAYMRLHASIASMV